MINTKLTRLASKIAYEAHKNQFDKAGVPYIFHPIHIAEGMTTEITCIVALLHDVVEDSNITLDDLSKYFDSMVIEALRVLTKKNDAMLFVYGSDNIGSIDIILFPNVYFENKDINKKDVIRVFGRVEKRYDKYQVIADKVNKLN